MISGQISWLVLAAGFPLLTLQDAEQLLDWPCFQQHLDQVTSRDSFHPKLFYKSMIL